MASFIVHLVSVMVTDLYEVFFNIVSTWENQNGRRNANTGPGIKKTPLAPHFQIKKDVMLRHEKPNKQTDQSIKRRKN